VKVRKMMRKKKESKEVAEPERAKPAAAIERKLFKEKSNSITWVIK
jgi:hypothetical protein